MARDEAPPFARGETFYNGVTKESIFTDPLNYLGKEYVFEVNSQDSTQGYPTSNDTSGRLIRVRVVQNVSGQALLPKRVARYKKTAPVKTQVDGYVFQVSDLVAGVIDEFLPAAGVANGDLFYLVVEGPTIAKSAVAGSVAFAIGDKLYALAGTSTLNADAGAVAEYTTPLLAELLQNVGVVDAAVTTNAADVAITAKILV